MAFDTFLIAPIKNGLQKDVSPWLLPEDSFAELTNAYVFRGSVRKRFGSNFTGTGASSDETRPLHSRLRIKLTTANGTTDVNGDAAGLLTNVDGGAIYAVGQMFSIGNEIFTVYQDGVMYTTGGATTHTYNLATGAYDFADATALTQIYFYPAFPVMGLTRYETGPINDQPAYAFDTSFAYLYTGTSWERSGTGTTPLWRGSNSNFVWTENHRGAKMSTTILFATNFQVTNLNGVGTITDDPIWWMKAPGIGAAATWGYSFDPATGLPISVGATNGSFFFSPTAATSNPVQPLTMGPYVKTARIIVSFKDRLLLLNTVENNNPGGVPPASLGTNSHYGNRCRFSHNGSPFAVNAWYQGNSSDTAGNKADGANWVDATTQEEIISAEFIKDRLIVYFEQSTWELVYTGNDVQPFRWQKINSELGSQAQFSTVSFDKVVLTAGNTGIHACNGANVESIDEKIPDETYTILNRDEGVKRVAGIRDYYVDMVYWTFPATTGNDPGNVYPNKVLVFNYMNGSWSYNQDCITCFGYLEQSSDTTWESTSMTWDEYDAAWDSGVLQANFKQVIAGNQQGFIFTIEADTNANAPVAQITDIAIAGELVTLTIIDHNFAVGEFISVENAQGTTGIDGIYKITDANYVADTVTIIEPDAAGAYTGGGVSARVSNYKILTKQFNPYVKDHKKVYLAKVDFCVEGTTFGEITVDYYPSSAELSMIREGTLTGSMLGSSKLLTRAYDPTSLEGYQDRLWHSVFFQSSGENIQLKLYMSDEQMVDAGIAWSGFQLDGFILHTEAIGHI